MKRKFILCLALALSGLLTGCETEYVSESHGTLTNLKGDGQSETLQKKSSVEYGTSFKNGWERTAFSLNDQSQVVLFYPTNKLNQVLQWQTESQQAFAWLVRTQYAGVDRSLFESAQSPSALMFPNSERLHGKIEVGRYDWRHKNLFHIGVDLAGDDGAVLKCDFNSYEKSKFDANQLWLDPYLLIFGWPNDSDSGPKPKRIVKGDWTDEKVTLYRATGDVLQLDGKQAIFTEIFGNGKLDSTIIAFVDPLTGKAWAGLKQTFYFETKSEIVGGFLDVSGAGHSDGSPDSADASLLWSYSPVPDVKSGEDANVFVKYFDKNVGFNGLQKEQRPDKAYSTLLGLVYGNKTIGLNPLPFIEAKPGSQDAFGSIDRIEAENGKLRLDLKSASGEHKASIWIDMETMKVTKVIQ
jgi:hypothetical protein